MAEFTPINTQEEFDKMIKDRLERERTSVKKDYEAQLAELETLKGEKKKWADEKAEMEKTAKEKADSSAELKKQLEAEQAKVKGFEKDNLRRKVAGEAGLPVTLAGRLQGETEEEMKEDAKSLAQLLKANNTKGLPLANLDNEGGEKNQTKTALKGMLKELTEGE